MSSLPQSAADLPKTLKAGGVVVPHAPRWHQRVGGWLVFIILRAVAGTLRCHWDDRSGYFTGSPAGPAIYCIWHNRLALSMRIYYGYLQQRNRTAGLAALVSASRDGGFLASVLECFKVQPVRGSSSRRGPQALLELTTWAERGYDLAITPDGPRGPRFVVQEGIIALAQITGRPIIPVSCRINWKIRARSWDGFQIPVAFSRCEMIFEKPIYIPREAREAEREALRAQLQQTLREMSKD
jgi:lysophospholipid acyltransferase (LPLAT)-like uncharacterized protein